jgi:hypothetical protein
MSLSLRPFRWIPFLLLVILSLAVAMPAHAASVDADKLDFAALAQLEQRALNARPSDQCYLFTELLRGLTEVAGKQMADGELEQALATFQHIDQITAKIRPTLNARARHLQDSEMLLDHTSRRLTDMLHVSTSIDREALQTTLKHLNDVHTEVLSQVFAH